MQNSFEKIVLDNGLTIYTYVDSKKHSTIVNLVTKFGGSYNDFYVDGEHVHIEDGMAHFIEHLLYETGPYGNLLDYFGERQMSSNALTGPNRTEYYFHAVEGLDDAIEVLLTSVNQACFTPHDIEKTKKAIYQEIRMGQDSKFQKLYNMTNQMLYHNISFQSVLGTLKRMEELTYEETLLCYETFYQPQNQVLFVMGNFDRDHIIQLVESIYSKFSFSKKEFQLFDYKEPIEVNQTSSSLFVPTNDTFVQVSFKLDLSLFTPHEKLDIDFMFSLFHNMNFGLTSSLYQELFDQNVIRDGIDYNVRYCHSYCVFSVGAYIYGDNDELFVRKVLDTIENPVYNSEMFELHQNYDRMHLAIRPDSLENMMSPFVDNLFIFDYPHVDSIDDVDRRSLDLMKDLFGRLDFSHYCVAKLVSDENNKK